MSTITINRNEASAIPFSITDAGNGLSGKRVTWAVAPSAGSPVLTKASGLPGSSAAVTITTQTASSIAGTINLAVADFTTLTADQYEATLWVDDGAGNDRCATAGGMDVLNINPVVKRS